MTVKNLAFRGLLVTLAFTSVGSAMALVAQGRGLLSADPVERDTFVKGVVSLTDSAVEDAIRILSRAEGEVDPWIRWHAIRVLGDLRSERGTDVLIGQISFRALIVSRSEALPFTLGDHYPALKSLVEIGHLGAERCIVELQNEPKISPIDRDKLFWVIYRIEGKEGGCFLMRRRLSELKSSGKSKPIAAALALFEQYELPESELPEFSVAR